MKDKSVILIDDVSNTGSTLIYVLSRLLELQPKKINTAVLVNRDHTLFPIKINYIGLSLSTSLNNHIEVKFKENDIGVFLT